MSDDVAGINELHDDAAIEALLRCCGSTKWAHEMIVARPFDDVDDLLCKADQAWWALEASDWLEAFSAHPKIGEKRAAVEPADSRQWSEEEQAGAAGATDDTQAELLRANRAYQNRFGHIFIVCATGKSADEMLALLYERLENSPEPELLIAAEEQRRIMQLRLQKLLRDDA